VKCPTPKPGGPGGGKFVEEKGLVKASIRGFGGFRATLFWGGRAGPERISVPDNVFRHGHGGKRKKPLVQRTTSQRGEGKGKERTQKAAGMRGRVKFVLMSGGAGTKDEFH